MLRPEALSEGESLGDGVGDSDGETGNEKLPENENWAAQTHAHARKWPIKVLNLDMHCQHRSPGFSGIVEFFSNFQISSMFIEYIKTKILYMCIHICVSVCGMYAYVDTCTNTSN